MNPSAQPVRLELTDAPVIGTTSAGQEIRLGGFSGLRFLGRSPTGLYQFVTHTDRGPNADPLSIVRAGKSKDLRPFGLPGFQPRLVFLDADLRLKKVFVRAQVPLTTKEGKPVLGLPSDENGEVAVDFHGKELGTNPDGLDLEGVALAPDGTFWMADEYGPSLVRFSADGVLLERILPGRGLPETLKYRRPNRGFESVAFSGGKIYAGLESPLDNPPSEGQLTAKRSRITRIVEADPARQLATAQFAYVLDEAGEGKLADLCAEGEGVFLAIEKGKESMRLYRVRLGAATNLQRLSSALSGPGGKLEQLAPEQLLLHGVTPVQKELQLDLRALGLTEAKVEGVDRVDDKFIALITDNDFGLAGGLDRANAVAEVKSEAPALYFVPLLGPR